MPSEKLTTVDRDLRFYDSLKARLLGWTGEKLGSRLRKIAELALLIPDITVLLGRVLLDPRVPRHLRIKVGIILTYLASPLDLLPEAVLGPAGLLDDLILTVFALNRVFLYVEEDILLEHWSGRPEQLEVLRELSDLAGGILSARWGERLKQWYEKPMENNAGPGREGRVELVSEKKEREEGQVERFRAAGL